MEKKNKICTDNRAESELSKIDDQTIARMACQLRDEENQLLHVRPWRRSRRLRLPAWVKVTAALFVGFFLGLWTKSHYPAEPPLTALVDTVYVMVRDSLSSPGPTLATAPAQPLPSAHKAKANRAPGRSPSRAQQGVSMAEDHIRYDLLVQN